MAKMLRITMIKSPITAKENHKRTLIALGLRKMNQTVERVDNDAIRGMCNTVHHLVRVEEIEG